MKNTFFILVFLNAVFFLWLYTQHSPKKPQPNVSADVQTLEMYAPEHLGRSDTASHPISELPVVTGSSESLVLNTPAPVKPVGLPATPTELNKPENKAQNNPQNNSDRPSTPLTPKTTHNNKNCVLIGPIADKARAISAQEYLVSQGYQASWLERKHTGGPVKFAYRVFIPPYPSFKEAKDITDKLKAKGIKDYYMITKSETKQYAISLGVFTRMAGVKVRTEQLSDIGFKTEYEVREREQDTVFWLTAASGKTLSDQDKTALEVFGIGMTYTKKSCKGE